MGSLFQNGETKPLLLRRKRNSNIKWNSKLLLEWGLKTFFLCLMFFGVIFVLLRNVYQQVSEKTTEVENLTKNYNNSTIR